MKKKILFISLGVVIVLGVAAYIFKFSKEETLIGRVTSINGNKVTISIVNNNNFDDKNRRDRPSVLDEDMPSMSMEDMPSFDEKDMPSMENRPNDMMGRRDITSENKTITISDTSNISEGDVIGVTLKGLKVTNVEIQTINRK